MPTDKVELTDAQKLVAFAKEVREMRIMQNTYFVVAAKSRKNEATREEVLAALNDSKRCESRVDKLLHKIFNAQLSLM